MKKTTLMFFITNEKMVNEKNHVNGFDGLFMHTLLTPWDKQQEIVIHVDHPIDGTEIIYALNSYAKCLEESGAISGHGYVLPLCGRKNCKYNSIMTTDNKYRQRGFMMDIW
jgi:hypothetical protein